MALTRPNTSLCLISALLRLVVSSSASLFSGWGEGYDWQYTMSRRVGQLLQRILLPYNIKY